MKVEDVDCNEALKVKNEKLEGVYWFNFWLDSDSSKESYYDQIIF